MQIPVLIHLFNNMSATPAELMEGAACYACIPKEMQLPALIALIAEGGSGEFGSCCSSGAVDPVAPPSGTSAVYYNTANGTFWTWENPTLTWIKLIG